MTRTWSPASAQPTRTAKPAKNVPTPESVIGFQPGKDSTLFLYDQSIDYFRALAKAQPSRVKLLEVGKTSMGHPWTAVLISSPQNLSKLGQALGRGVKEARVEASKAQAEIQGRVVDDEPVAPTPDEQRPA